MKPESEPAAAAPAAGRYRLPRLEFPALRAALSLAAGAALTASFAPFNLWPLALVSPAALMWLWQGAGPREAARLGFLFSAATFAAGTYWLYVSIHVNGGAPVWLTVVLMVGLVAIMGLYQAALGYAVARWLPERGALRTLAALPAAWLLVEWWRGWFLTGFSWLSLGYSQTDTWLGAFAPLVGVYGISALLLLGAGALLELATGGPRARIPAALLLLAPWAAGAALHGYSWTRPAGSPVTVAVVQGAIPRTRSGSRATATRRSSSMSRSPSRRSELSSSSGRNPRPPMSPTTSFPTSATSTARRALTARRSSWACCARMAVPPRTIRRATSTRCWRSMRP